MYQLWDLVSGNLIETYPTEAEALAWVRRYLEDDGPEFVTELGLDGPGDGGQRLRIADGPALVELARTVAPATVG